jgi:sodium-dependent dicarboxylate transporter 2/3/5
LKDEFAKLAPMNRGEKATIVVFLFTVVFWLTSGLLEGWLKIRIPISMTVVFTSSLLFIPAVTGIRWARIERDMSWGSILLVLAGVSMGITLHRSGAASWLSQKLLGGFFGLQPVLIIFLTILLVSLLKVGLSSNSVSATITVPIMIAFALQGNLPVLQTVLPAAVTSSLSFILVTSAPTNVITYAAGYYTVWDMAKAGILLTIVASVLGAVIIYGVSLLVIAV